MSDDELRIKAAKFLALVEHHAPKEWRYDGTHAAGNQMLRTVDTVMGFLKASGWGPRVAASILAKLAAAEAWQISTEGEVFVQVDYNLFNPVPLDETELAFLAAVTEGTSEQ